MPTPKQLYTRKLQEIARRFNDLDEETIRRSLQFLKDLRDRLQLELTQTEGLNVYRLRQISSAVDALTAEYEAKLMGLSNTTLRESARLGALSVVEPIQAAGLSAGFFQATPAQLNVIMDFSADLIRGLTAEIKNMINREIRMAALGERSSISAMQAINRLFGFPTDRRRLPEGGIAYKGERIVRTELGRVYNLSNYSQQLVTAQAVPGLLKGWLATGDKRTRFSHMIAHQRYAADPIPIADKFRVGRDYLDYPLDPAGSAGETINCRCRMITIHPEIGRIGGPQDGRIERELERRRELA